MKGDRWLLSHGIDLLQRIIVRLYTKVTTNFSAPMSIPFFFFFSNAKNQKKKKVKTERKRKKKKKKESMKRQWNKKI